MESKENYKGGFQKFHYDLLFSFGQRLIRVINRNTQNKVNI